MGSLHYRRMLAVSATTAWDFLERYTKAQVHVFSICTKEWMEDDYRVVQLTNGDTVRERNVTVDQDRMRASYTIAGVYGAEHHAAEMRVFREPDGSASLEWITDYLPHSLVDDLRELYAKLFEELVDVINNHVSPAKPVE